MLSPADLSPADRSFALPCLSCLLINKWDGAHGGWRIALLPRFGRAKSDGKTEEKRNGWVGVGAGRSGAGGGVQ